LSGKCDTADALIQHMKHADPKQREALIQSLQASLAGSMNGHSSSAQLLDWSEVKEMANAGIVFGSHTNSHQILTEVPAAEAREELTESRKAIETRLDSCAWFAYPNGDWSESLRDLVAHSGYEAAFINSPGVWRRSSNRFSIPRVNVWEGSLTSPSGRFSRMALEYAIFWKAWRR